MRALGILPQGNGNVTANGAGIGGSTHVTDSSVPEVDGSYFLTDHIALELIAATTKHAVHRDNSAWEMWMSAASGCCRRRSRCNITSIPKARIRPYVGAGVNYTYYYSPENTGILNDVKYQSNWGGRFRRASTSPSPVRFSSIST